MDQNSQNNRIIKTLILLIVQLYKKLRWLNFGLYKVSGKGPRKGNNNHQLQVFATFCNSRPIMLGTVQMYADKTDKTHSIIVKLQSV